MSIEPKDIFNALQEATSRPGVFEFYTAPELWTDEYTSAQMLKYHLEETVDLSSRNKAFIEQSVAWIVEHFDVKAGTRIADFGCGPGLYTNRLANYGATVTGIDISPRSIAYAHEQAAVEGLEVEYVNRNYLAFDSDARFDLITMIFCDFCVLSPEQRRTMLSKFAKLLAPGGRVLLDVTSLAAFDAREEATTFQRNLLNGFWSADEYFGFLCTFKYPEEKVVLDKYTIIEKTRQRTVYNWMQCFDRATIEAEFTASGLSIQETYADVAGGRYDENALQFAVVASRQQ